jgi:hypothetical protein
LWSSRTALAFHAFCAHQLAPFVAAARLWILLCWNENQEHHNSEN